MVDFKEKKRSGQEWILEPAFNVLSCDLVVCVVQLLSHDRLTLLTP